VSDPLIMVQRLREVVKGILAELDTLEGTLKAARAQTTAGAPVTNPLTQLAEKYKDLIKIDRSPKAVILRPTTWLGDKKWSEINGQVKQLGGTWITAGKESHWEVPA